MHIFSSFDQSIHIETALTELEQSGIAGKNILAVPLDSFPQDLDQPGAAARADRFGFVDDAAALGTAGMVLGVIYGFVLSWGPIIWGLIGLLAGAAAGVGLHYLRNPRRFSPRPGENSADGVILLVQCGPEMAAAVEKILWRSYARGVGRLER